MAIVGKRKGAAKSGGRTKGTPNKRSRELLQGLLDEACVPAQEIAQLLQSPDMAAAQKMECWQFLLPYLYPQRKAIDPDGYLTLEQASGMLGAEALRFRRIVEAHVPDAMLTATILEALRER